MRPLVDIVGIHFIDAVFCVSALCLLYVTCCQLIIPSCLLFVSLLVSYKLIQKTTAKRIEAAGKYVLITGCDAGFGNAIARQLDRRGMNVLATCLSENSDGAKRLKETGSKRLHVLQMDVSSDESVANCLQKVNIICRNEGMWALINNAGIMCSLDVELLSLSHYKRVADVNLFGVVRVCKAFLPLIRKRKGRIINVTSCHGLMARVKGSAYAITKHGAEGFSDSLRLEMKRFDVKVIIIEPGEYGFQTAQFNAENVKRYEAIAKEAVHNASEEIREAYGEEYLSALLKIRKQVSDVCDEMIQPVVDAYEDAVLNSQPKSRYMVGGKKWIDKHCMFARLNCVFPAFIMDYLYSKIWPLPKKRQ